MEQQVGDNEEARGDLNLQKLWELINESFKNQKEDNNQMNENFRQINEKVDRCV